MKWREKYFISHAIWLYSEIIIGRNGLSRNGTGVDILSNSGSERDENYILYNIYI